MAMPMPSRMDSRIANPICIRMSIIRARVREPSRAIRMSNSTASPLTSRSVPEPGTACGVTGPVKHVYAALMDLDAYVAEHAAQWRRLEHLSSKRRLGGPEVDELIS